MEVIYQRDVLVDVVIHHHRESIKGCSCGWSQLGLSWADHVADVYESAVNEQLDDLVDAWHQGDWQSPSLEDVIRLRTGWTHQQFDRWVTGGLRAVDG